MRISNRIRLPQLLPLKLLSWVESHNSLSAALNTYTEYSNLKFQRWKSRFSLRKFQNISLVLKDFVQLETHSSQDWRTANIRASNHATKIHFVLTVIQLSKIILWLISPLLGSKPFLGCALPWIWSEQTKFSIYSASTYSSSCRRDIRLHCRLQSRLTD